MQVALRPHPQRDPGTAVPQDWRDFLAQSIQYSPLRAKAVLSSTSVGRARIECRVGGSSVLHFCLFDRFRVWVPVFGKFWSVPVACATSRATKADVRQRTGRSRVHPGVDAHIVTNSCLFYRRQCSVELVQQVPLRLVWHLPELHLGATFSLHLCGSSSSMPRNSRSWRLASRSRRIPLFGFSACLEWSPSSTWVSWMEAGSINSCAPWP